MRIDSSGNVSIGTSSPNAYSGYNTLTIDSPSSGSGSVVDFEYRGTRHLSIYSEASSSDINVVTAHPLKFRTSNTERMNISSDGDININKSARIEQTALTSSSNAVAWNAKTQGNAYHLTTENTTFAAPSNAVEGAIISVEIAQGGTARTIAWNTVLEFAASTTPTMTATASKTDIYSFRYNGSVWQEIGRVQNMAQT